jgi:3-oxoacyl-[acyl-carrier-protein] synthase-3
VAYIPARFGVALGDKKVRNEEVYRNYLSPPTPALLKKIGVDSRFLASSEEDALSLSKSALSDLYKSGVLECDLLIGVTQTQQIRFPHMSALLQAEFFPNSFSPSFDINLGCSGFVYALLIVNSLAATLHRKNPIVVCADTYNKFIINQNNSAALIFSDASVAVAFEFSKESAILGFDIGSDGRGADKLCVGSSQIPQSTELSMDGASVMIFTMNTVPGSVRRTLDMAGIALEDVDLFLFHQASAVVLGEIKRKLGIPSEKMPSNLFHVGNTVSCSIPLLMSELYKEQKIQKGMKLLLSGFGVGLSWATCLIRI